MQTHKYCQQTFIIPPQERERQCLLLNGARDSAEGVCFSIYTEKYTTLRVGSPSTLYACLSYHSSITLSTCLMSFFFLADSGMLLTCW